MVARRWETYEAQMRQFLASLTDAALTRSITYTIPPLALTGAGRIGDLLHHAINHNTHHRGQVALLLRVLGQVPGNVDILFYHSEPHAIT